MIVVENQGEFMQVKIQSQNIVNIFILIYIKKATEQRNRLSTDAYEKGKDRDVIDNVQLT